MNIQICDKTGAVWNYDMETFVFSKAKLTLDEELTKLTKGITILPDKVKNLLFGPNAVAEFSKPVVAAYIAYINALLKEASKDLPKNGYTVVGYYMSISKDLNTCRTIDEAVYWAENYVPLKFSLINIRRNKDQKITHYFMRIGDELRLCGPSVYCESGDVIAPW